MCQMSKNLYVLPFGHRRNQRRNVKRFALDSETEREKATGKKPGKKRYQEAPAI